MAARAPRVDELPGNGVPPPSSPPPAATRSPDPTSAPPARPLGPDRATVMVAQRRMAEEMAGELDLDEPVLGRFVEDYMEFVGRTVAEVNFETQGMQTARMLIAAKQAEFEARARTYLTPEQSEKLAKRLRFPRPPPK